LIVKHVFLRWEGSEVSAEQQEAFNAKSSAAEALVQGSCTIAHSLSSHSQEDISLKEIVKQLHSSSGDSAANVTVEQYQAALEQDKVLFSGKAEEEKQVLPSHEDAVSAVRNPSGKWNWVLMGVKLSAGQLSSPRADVACDSDQTAQDTMQNAGDIEMAVRPDNNSKSKGKTVMFHLECVEPSHVDQAARPVERCKSPMSSTFSEQSSRHESTSYPHWGTKSDMLHERVGWWWTRHFYELRQGHLQWWATEEDFKKKSKPLGTIHLVEGVSRWRVESVKGKQVELCCSNKEARRADRCVLCADDALKAKEWADAIRQHIEYIEMQLLLWPMPPDGRQGDVRSYGISYPL